MEVDFHAMQSSKNNLFKKKWHIAEQDSKWQRPLSDEDSGKDWNNICLKGWVTDVSSLWELSLRFVSHLIKMGLA